MVAKQQSTCVLFCTCWAPQEKKKKNNNKNTISTSAMTIQSGREQQKENAPISLRRCFQTRWSIDVDQQWSDSITFKPLVLLTRADVDISVLAPHHGSFVFREIKGAFKQHLMQTKKKHLVRTALWNRLSLFPYTAMWGCLSADSNLCCSWPMLNPTCTKQINPHTFSFIYCFFLSYALLLPLVPPFL